MTCINKMVAVFCLLLILVIGFSARANPKNPMMRACTQTFGHSRAANLEDPVNDQFLFCQYSESSLVDGLSVLKKLEGQETLALLAYKQNLNANPTTCLSNNGQLIRGADLEGVPFVFCYFAEDASSMELNTLLAGPNNPVNSDLNRALGY